MALDRFLRMQRRLRTGILMTAGFSILGVPSIWGGAAKQRSGKLQIYVIDVEGGQSTLFVTPAGQSLLIDTGWDDHANRDAKRIVAAAKSAALSRIDYVLITHFHGDHVGGVPQLVARIPVGTFIDHGANRQPDAATEQAWEAYQRILATGKYKHIVPRPGDVLPIRGLYVQVISSDGNVIQKPLSGGGEQNPYCAKTEQRPADQTENARSLGVWMRFGNAKLLDLGDLTWDKEVQFMCPVNKLGHVDVLIVSHHGTYPSSSPALVDGISPIVAIMDNGETKGGSPSTLDTIRGIPGLQALWQLHYSKEGGTAHNTPAEYIANLQGTDPGNYFKVTVGKNGSIRVMNSRTGETRDYHSKK